MKKGKIVLGVAAAIVTVSGALAFKASHNYRSKLLYGFTTVSRQICKQCASLWATSVAHQAKTCYTAAGGANAGVVITLTGGGLNNHTFYTQKVNGACQGPITKVTVTP